MTKSPFASLCLRTLLFATIALFFASRGSCSLLGTSSYVVRMNFQQFFFIVGSPCTDCPHTQIAKSLFRYETVSEMVRPSHLLTISYMYPFTCAVCSTNAPDNGSSVSILCISSLFSRDVVGINKNSM